MRVLYIYPHPDDESFGPAPAMAAQRRQGHEVHLLTLTRGGATRQRLRLGYSVAEMGAVRHAEMQEVAKVLDLTGLTVLDLPDSGLAELDPRVIEAVIRTEVERVRPDVLVSYPVHGVSAFRDHLVAHAVVKHVFWELRGRAHAPRRLAFHTLSEEAAARSTHFHLTGSRSEEIDCLLEVAEEDLEKGQRALDCYATYRETIETSGVRTHLRGPICFEFHDERFDPPVTDLFAELPQ